MADAPVLAVATLQCAPAEEHRARAPGAADAGLFPQMQCRPGDHGVRAHGAKAAAPVRVPRHSALAGAQAAGSTAVQQAVGHGSPPVVDLYGNHAEHEGVPRTIRGTHDGSPALAAEGRCPRPPRRGSRILAVLDEVLLDVIGCLRVITADAEHEGDVALLGQLLQLLEEPLGLTGRYVDEL